MAIKAQHQSEVRRLLESIEIEVNTVFRAAELLETELRDEPSAISESPPDRTDLAPIFCELRDMLKTHNLKALQVYEQLENQLPGSSTEVVALNQCISKLDFRGAFEQLYLLADKYCIKM